MTVNEKSFALAQVSYLGFVAALSFALLSMPWMAFLGLSCVWVVAMLVYQCTPWRSMGGWWCLLAATVAEALRLILQTYAGGLQLWPAVWGSVLALLTVIATGGLGWRLLRDDTPWHSYSASWVVMAAGVAVTALMAYGVADVGCLAVVFAMVAGALGLTALRRVPYQGKHKAVYVVLFILSACLAVLYSPPGWVMLLAGVAMLTRWRSQRSRTIMFAMAGALTGVAVWGGYRLYGHMGVDALCVPGLGGDVAYGMLAVWCVVGGLVSYYLLFCRRRTPKVVGRMTLWAVLMWAVSVFVYPSPVWVGGLPFVLVMLPACVYVLASCRGRRLWIWAGVWTVLSVSVAFSAKMLL